jgi:O-antigen ligase
MRTLSLTSARAYPGRREAVPTDDVLEQPQAEAHSLFERATIIAALFLSTGALSDVLFGTSRRADELVGQWSTVAVWSLVYLFVAIWFFKRPLRLTTFVKSNTWLALLIVWALSSVVWSDATLITVRRGCALALTSLLGVFVGVRYSARQRVELLATALLVVTALSVGLSLWAPSIGTALDSGSSDWVWIGAFGHKNMLGKVSVLAFVVFAFQLLASPRRTLYLVGTALALLLLVQSHSRGAQVAGVAVIAVGLGAYAIRKSGKALPIALIVCGVVFAGIISWLLTDWDVIVSQLGRDATLTGRTVLWERVLLWIPDHLWIGRGYNAFWGVESGESADIRLLSGWDVPHSHNGFLDVVLDLGLVGLGLFVCACLSSIVRAVRLLRAGPSAIAAWPFVFLVLFILTNIGESGILVRNNIWWICFVAVAAGSYDSNPSSAPRQRLRPTWN